MSAPFFNDPGRIASALAFVPPHDRDTWVKMGMAIKSELSDEEGLSVWDRWSQGADSYNESEARTVWRGIDAGGKVGIGSLFHEAKANGWIDDGKAIKPDPLAVAQRNAERAKDAARAADDKAKKRARAAEKTVSMIDAAAPAGADHPYLVRKKIKPVDALYELDLIAATRHLRYSPTASNGGALTGRLLIVTIKIKGAISSCELIDEIGLKHSIAGGAKSGGYWAAQELPDVDGPEPLQIAEGMATALSSRQANDYLTVSAMGSSNLSNVAQAMRKRYPTRPLIILADLLKDTGEPDPHAVVAAHAVGGVVAVPEFGIDRLKEKTDMNDMAEMFGLEEVKRCIDAALTGQVESENWDVVDGDAAGTAGASANKSQKEKKAPHKTIQPINGIPKGFTISDRGVYFTPDGSEDNPGKPMRICSPIRVTALVRDGSSTNWGSVIEFKDRDGVPHKWAIPSEMLAGDGMDVRRELARMGLSMASNQSAKNRFVQYLIDCSPAERARCVQQTGWSGNVFVMPDRTIGVTTETILYQSESKKDCPYEQKGTLEHWRDTVGKLCIGNSRLIFSASAAMAGMILHHTGQEAGGFNFFGGSSTGKSTAQLVAASVYGSPTFKQSWRATGNALEGSCALHNDAALILDEMAEVDPKEIGSIVYMIGNGTGKGRANQRGDARQRKTWRLMIISSAEIGLAQHMRDGGKVTKAGQEVRMLDIEADAGAGHGMFEVLHGYEGGAKFSDAIREATQANYGTPALAFLEWLTSDLKAFCVQLKPAMNAFVSSNLPADAGGQAARACNKFAVIAIAGEYATEAGITGWQQGDAARAAATCFKSWLDGRGGGGNQEKSAILSSVKAFFESHSESRFTDINGAPNIVTRDRVGFRDKTAGGHQYFVLTEAYKREVCAGFDMKTVTKILIEAGWIASGKDGGTSQAIRLLELGKTRCYVFTPKMWEA